MIGKYVSIVSYNNEYYLECLWFSKTAFIILIPYTLSKNTDTLLFKERIILFKSLVLLYLNINNNSSL